MRHSTRRLAAFIAFLVLAFLWSWACWGLASVLLVRSKLASEVLSGLGGFGPSLAALAVVSGTGGRPALRQWLRRCLRWRIGWKPFAWAFCLPLVVLVPAAVLHLALGGTLGPSPIGGHLPMAAANLVLILLLGGPMGEEFGWRGYAWPVLHVACGWRVSSVVLGLAWGLWHGPLFFIAGTLQSRLPFMPFLASTVALSVVFGWLAERSRGSVLPALTLHTAVNWWAWVVPGLLRPDDHRQVMLSIGLLMVLATGLLISPPACADAQTSGPPRDKLGA